MSRVSRSKATSRCLCEGNVTRTMRKCDKHEGIMRAARGPGSLQRVWLSFGWIYDLRGAEIGDLACSWGNRYHSLLLWFILDGVVVGGTSGLFARVVIALG